MIAKNADPNKVIEGFNKFNEKVKGMLEFNASDFVHFMEPYYREAGYRQPRPQGEKKEILVVRDDAAGDFVLFSPVLRELRRLYPAARITLLASIRNAGLAYACPYIDNIIVEDKPFDSEDFSQSYRHSLDLSLQLLKYNFDIAFAGRLGIRSLSLLIMYMAGARVRVGFTQNRPNPDGNIPDTGWDSLLTVKVPWLMNYMHDVDRNLMLLETLLKLPIDNRELEVWFTNKDLETAKKCLLPMEEKSNRKFLALVPSASIASKVWPVERFIQLAKAIQKSVPDVAFAVLGGPGDYQAGEIFCKAMGEEYSLNLAGKLKFSESAAVISRCQQYIGCDTGLMHIAAALKLPVLSVNCFPVDMPMEYMSIPVRFAPYRVPGVVVYPSKHMDDCDDKWGYGCKVTERSHCILGVSAERMVNGFSLLQDKIRAKDNTTSFIK